MEGRKEGRLALAAFRTFFCSRKHNYVRAYFLSLVPTQDEVTGLRAYVVGKFLNLGLIGCCLLFRANQSC